VRRWSLVGALVGATFGIIGSVFMLVFQLPPVSVVAACAELCDPMLPVLQPDAADPMGWRCLCDPDGC
jgi:hypothetical protein